MDACVCDAVPLSASVCLSIHPFCLLKMAPFPPPPLMLMVACKQTDLHLCGLFAWLADTDCIGGACACGGNCTGACYGIPRQLVMVGRTDNGVVFILWTSAAAKPRQTGVWFDDSKELLHKQK